MSAKIGKDYAMSAAVIEVRSKLKGLVVRRERLTRSWMLAYSDIGAQIGRSESWVRAFLSGDPRYSMNHVIAKNIEALCERIETGNQKIRAEDAAAHQGSSGMHSIEDSATLLPPNDY
jgi:hypothetical protein